jgi:hypothetical protein
LISYSSADSFIKRDYVLDVIDKNSKFTEHQHNADLSSYNFIHLTSANSLKAYSMSKEGSKRLLVQHRREYYNDFEDCLRDFKNQKIKSIQKQTKVHHSDGDNGESDSEYVDCTDNSSDFKQQSTLSSKSLPHVPVENYHDDDDNFRRESEYYKFTTKMPAASSVHVTTTTTAASAARTICNETRTSDIMATTKAQKPPQMLKIKSNDGTQLNKNYDDCRKSTQSECTEQIKAHNRNNKSSSNSNSNNNSCSSSSYKNNNQNNQVVDKRRGSDKVSVNEKSISIDECPSTSAVPIIDDKKISKKPQVVSSTQQLPQLVDISTVEVRVVTKQPAAIINDDVSATINAKKDDMKRKSCKKRQGSIKDPSQR